MPNASVILHAAPALLTSNLRPPVPTFELCGTLQRRSANLGGQRIEKCRPGVRVSLSSQNRFTRIALVNSISRIFSRFFASSAKTTLALVEFNHDVPQRSAKIIQKCPKVCPINGCRTKSNMDNPLVHLPLGDGLYKAIYDDFGDGGIGFAT